MNSINWFEIPATDISRAAKFYGSILNEKLEVMDFANTKMAMIGQGGEGQAHGALRLARRHWPSLRRIARLHGSQWFDDGRCSMGVVHRRSIASA
jgi:predicted enzyme related to lactoylglutathione lyase